MKRIKIAGYVVIVFFALVGAYFIFFDAIPVQIECGWALGLVGSEKTSRATCAAGQMLQANHAAALDNRTSALWSNAN